MGRRIWSALLLFLAGMAFFLMNWTYSAEQAAHRQPSCARRDLTEILAKLGTPGGGKLQEAARAFSYRTVFYQTGLSPRTVETLISGGREADILTAQEIYFRPVLTECEPNTIISREERLIDENGGSARGMPVWAVEDGDILINFNSHVFGWRNGHAAIVIDAEKRLTLEAQVMGSPSAVCPLDRWEGFPSYAVLRLRDADAETRRRVAQYAVENLADIPYRLTAGLRRSAGRPSGTQCAHLVWYAYKQFGYDLDSDGGWIVTPRDLFESPLLEIVQIYGLQGGLVW